MMIFTFLLISNINKVNAQTPTNSVITGASGVVPTSTISFNNTQSPTTAKIALCNELTKASSFMWYVINPVSYLRTVTIDTCNSTFDTVIGVFLNSGTSLSVLGCNDDRTFNSSSTCAPTTSRLNYIFIEANQKIYIVVGGFVDPISKNVSNGAGSLTVKLIASGTLPCSSSTSYTTYYDLPSSSSSSPSSSLNEEKLSSTSSSTSYYDTTSEITSKIDSHASEIKSSIGGLEDVVQRSITHSTLTITNLITKSSDQVVANIHQIEDSLKSFETSITSVNIEIQSFASSFSIIENQLLNIQSSLNFTNDNLHYITNEITLIYSSLHSQFDSTNELIHQIQTKTLKVDNTLTTIQSTVGSMFDTIIGLQIEIQSTNEKMNETLQSTNSHLSSMNDSINELSSYVQNSNDEMNHQLIEISNQITNLLTEVNHAIHSIQTINVDLISETANLMFFELAEKYLSDQKLTPPNTLRIPNQFGGKLNDLENYVLTIYKSLLSNALIIGSKDSPQCLDHSFCNYFLNDADPLFSSSINQYYQLYNQKKFHSAYISLQTAYSSLFPITW